MLESEQLRNVSRVTVSRVAPRELLLQLPESLTTEQVARVMQMAARHR